MDREKKTDHQHLLIKELMGQVRTSQVDFRKLIKEMY